MTPYAAIVAAAAACAPVLGRTALDDLLEHLDAEPWRIVLLGRTGVGKTSLVNALAGRKIGPVGLGGVTEEPVAVRIGAVELVDTPGIDAEDLAIERARPILHDADAVLWIVDGLQPVTASERAVLAAVLGGRRLDVLVARMDLVDEPEHEAVLARVRQLATGARHVAPVDPRSPVLPPDLLLPGDSSPRRQEAARAALQDVQRRLDALPPITSAEDVLAALRAAWRDTVRAVEAAIEDRIARGLVAHKDTALRLLAAEATTARDRLLERLPTLGMPLPTGSPELPVPEAPPTGALRDALGAFAGQEGARRVLRAGAGRIVLEGDLALEEWVASGIPSEAERERRQRARAAVAAAARTLG